MLAPCGVGKDGLKKKPRSLGKQTIINYELDKNKIIFLNEAFDKNGTCFVYTRLIMLWLSRETADIFDGF